MARSNVNAGRLRPQVSELLTAHALRRERLSPTFVRVTLGGEDLARFAPMGADQWFRLFLPVDDGATLSRLPARLDTVAYLRYLAIARTRRPVLRNYTVRAFRPDGPLGPELDVDFVLHGSAADGTAGPAATWASTCTVGDSVALIDEGVTFNPPPGCEQLLLVADETGLPAVAAILEQLPAGARGSAVLEVQHPDDRQDLAAPEGMAVTWLVRTDPLAPTGRAALDAVAAVPLPAGRCYGWAVGESALATGARRHWVQAGLAKSDVTFCGYWRAPRKRAVAA